MAWRTPWLLLVAYKRFDLLGSALTALLALAGLGVWQDLLPWWAPWATLAVLLLYSLLMGNYEEVRDSAQKQKELEEKLTSDKERADFKNLLTKACQEGQRIHDSHADDALAIDWGKRVCNFIDAALGLSEAQDFYSDTGLLPIAPANDTSIRQWIRWRQKRIEKLKEKVDRDRPNFRPEFRLQDWQDHFYSGFGN